MAHLNMLKSFSLRLLKEADITVNGTRPWDITMHNPAVFQRVLQQGSLGLGESYNVEYLLNTRPRKTLNYKTLSNVKFYCRTTTHFFAGFFSHIMS